MKNSQFVVCSALIAAATLSAPFSFAQDKADAPKMDPQMAAAWERAAKAGTPGAPHKALEPLVGEWTCEVKTWMSPEAPPMESKGTSKTTWILNGRFVHEEFSGDMGGQAFKGMGMYGYDNTKQKYVITWVDDMTTAIFTAEGVAQDGGKAFAFMGKMYCAPTDEHDRPVMHVIRIISNDKHVMEMSDPRLGDKGRMMEITYTRKK